MSEVSNGVPAGPGAPPADGGVPLPTGAELLRGVGGFLAAGACAGIGASAPEIAARAVPAGLAVAVGSMVLTGPALVVGHQFLGLGARPVDLAAALADGFVRAGRTAAGLSPALAFFSLTTGGWGVGAASVAGAAAVVGFGWSGTALRRTEPGSGRMAALVAGWTLLAGLAALRLGVDVAARVRG